MDAFMGFLAENKDALLWLVVTVILVAVEMNTAQMICIWFAVGAFVTTIAAMFGISGTAQFLLFAGVSALTLACTRGLVKNTLKVPKTPTNADSVIGLCGSVIEEIDNKAGTGRIRLSGLDWAARTVDGSTVHIGETVVAQSIVGVKLMVTRQE